MASLKRETQNMKKYQINHRGTFNLRMLRNVGMRNGYLTSNCLVWQHVIRSKIKSALYDTFLAAKSRENNATTQTTLPDQQRLNNQHTRAVAFDGQPWIGAVKTNSMHELTSSKSAAQQVAYVSQWATNTTLSSYKSTHGLATTSSSFLCCFSIASHRSLLWRQTWRGSSEWLTACRNKQIRKDTF